MKEELSLKYIHNSAAAVHTRTRVPQHTERQELSSRRASMRPGSFSALYRIQTA